jgi:hypothetical protein
VADNANEAAKIRARVTGVAGGGSDGGGLLEPFRSSEGALADATGLGWCCLRSE